MEGLQRQKKAKKKQGLGAPRRATWNLFVQDRARGAPSTRGKGNVREKKKGRKQTKAALVTHGIFGGGNR